LQRPAEAGARAALVKKAGRNMFPTAKLKSLPPLVPGSRRETFRERGQGETAMHVGEVTTDRARRRRLLPRAQRPGPRLLEAQGRVRRDGEGMAFTGAFRLTLNG
jgi:hypothetical protein